MRYKAIVLLLVSSAFMSVHLAEAQQPKKVPRIGYLTATSLSAIAARTEAFRQGLRELGYVEGKNIVIEQRHAEGKLDRLPALASELVRLNVDVIVSAGPGDTRAAKDVTSTIPIIMAQDSDPVGNGFVASLARPGGNITGLATLAPEISGKRLELLKETVPRLARLTVFGRSTRLGNAQALTEVELAATTLRVRLQYVDVKAQRILRLHFKRRERNVRTQSSCWRVLFSLINEHRLLNLRPRPGFRRYTAGQKTSNPEGL